MLLLGVRVSQVEKRCLIELENCVSVGASCRQIHTPVESRRW